MPPPLEQEQSRLLSDRIPEPGQLVHVRSRLWLVEEVLGAGQGTQVRLACVEDDNQGAVLEVFWDLELDRQILEDEAWGDLGQRGFDSPRRFAAFLNTLRWGTVTATDPQLFQSPFRAGIKVDAYQMEPLRKALKLPRVNLFIADDTGLGKTIEAGLIARELLLRKKVKRIVVAAPPSVLEQWQAELEERFGLLFVILDRAYFARMRRERGFGINPWRTHSRFLVSHRLLIDETYAEPLRQWLDEHAAGNLLILDEAHHAAPSSGGMYGIESQFTRIIRDLAPRFEHRLFLSATPHNGHSNSFSTLLELLDPYRFTRGIPIRKSALDEVMVRRLKEDIRNASGGFPRREVLRIALDGLPEHAPELELSRLLDRYRSLREAAHASATKRQQAAAGLAVVGLQQRLLSSIDAFARSLKVHRTTLERAWAKPTAPEALPHGLRRALLDLGDEEREDALEDEAESDRDDELMRAATLANPAEDSAAEQRALLDRMAEIAEQHRDAPDAKARFLIDWIREQLCPGLPPFGQSVKGPAPTWNQRRVLIFTENRQGTKQYLKTLLNAAIANTDRADQRIAVIDGLTSSQHRKEIQRRFNTHPDQDPLRILLATDAAREGLNFQAHCADLFHFDLPWNPGRIEQRNGRIDRKLQPADEVRCHYFVLPQRVEDRVLEVLVKKTETIRRELGSLSKVIEGDLEQRLAQGIRHADADRLAGELLALDLEATRRQTTANELEAARERGDKLEAQLEICRNLLEKSRDWLAFNASAFRDALSVSLEILNAKPLEEQRTPERIQSWRLPDLSRQIQQDGSWTQTLDSLRPPRRAEQTLAEWRRDAPLRPVIFEDAGVLTEDTVHLHLDQRLAQRLLARFRSQGFRYHDLSRACLAQAADSIPRVILLGRLSLYGQGAERLHEELVPIAARWIEPARRKGPLEAFARAAEDKTLNLLHKTLQKQQVRPLDAAVERRLLASAPADIQDLLCCLEPRARELSALATQKLQERGAQESEALIKSVTDQQKHVREELRKKAPELAQGTLAFEGFTSDERRQLELDVKHWQRRLEGFDRDLAEEPERIRRFYTVEATRIEPVGLVYLWPESN